MKNQLFSYISQSKSGLAFVILVLCVICCYSSKLQDSGQRQSIVNGKCFFLMQSDTISGKTIRVWTYKPTGWTDTNRILFVMHGMNRNAEDYLDAWIQIAEDNKLLLIAPEFANRNYMQVSRDYQEGNVFSVYGKINPKELWAFSVVENIFDTIIQTNRFNSDSYDIFGHSGGAQFVHRMIVLFPENRINIAIAANAGFYTFIDPFVRFPYGIKDIPTTLDSTRKSFQSSLIILLGEEDDNPYHNSLRQTRKAKNQGKHRLERGTNFYENSLEFAKKHHMDFNWQFDTIPNVGHSYKKMAVEAIKYLNR